MPILAADDDDDDDDDNNNFVGCLAKRVRQQISLLVSASTWHRKSTREDIEDITRPRGDTKFLFEC